MQKEKDIDNDYNDEAYGDYGDYGEEEEEEWPPKDSVPHV